MKIGGPSKTSKPRQAPIEQPLQSREPETFQSGDKVFLGSSKLPHLAATAYTPEEVDTPQERSEVANQLLKVMEEYPHKTMVVGVVESPGRETSVIVAGPSDAVSQDETVGVYEFLQRTGSSSIVKSLAAAFPSSYSEVTPFDGEGKVDQMRLPGPLASGRCCSTPGRRWQA